MALVLQQYMPVIDYHKLLEDSKSIRVVGTVVAGVHLTWKVLRMISMSGNSSNPVLRFLHHLLRRYMNCGVLVRSEFGLSLPWQFFLRCRGNYAIVNYGSYGTVPNAVMDYHHGLQVYNINIFIIKQ